MRLVFFDFDGTLTTRDTIRPFASFLCRASVRSARSLARLDLASLLLKLRLTSNHAFKLKFLELLVRGESVTRISSLAGQFHCACLQPILNQQLVDLLMEHTAAGDDVYLVSSNFDFFLRPLMDCWGLKGILATQAELRDECFTGGILGRTCDGREKLARVIAWFGERRVREATAYGNSRGDSFLLEYVRTSHWVSTRRSLNASPSLRTA